MAVERDRKGRLQQTSAYAALDSTEKGMVSYFLGMTLCKLFASRLLQTPWLLHLDVFRSQLRAVNLGRSRPDLIGESLSGEWHAFESKGRSSVPSSADKAKAKAQARRLISVDGMECSLHVGSFAYFRSGKLEFFWGDPDPETEDTLSLPHPEEEWRYYYEPSRQLAAQEVSGAQRSDLELADVQVEIYPSILATLRESRWLDAKRTADELREDFSRKGFQPDGLRVEAGESWERPFTNESFR